MAGERFVHADEWRDGVGADGFVAAAHAGIARAASGTDGWLVFTTSVTECPSASSFLLRAAAAAHCHS